MQKSNERLQEYNSKATTGLVLGIIGLVMAWLPIAGLPLQIIGLVFSIKGLNSEKRGKAMAGMILVLSA